MPAIDRPLHHHMDLMVQVVKDIKLFALLLTAVFLWGCSPKHVELHELIGIQANAPAVQNCLKQMRATEDSTYGDVYYYVSKDCGIDFCFERGEVETVLAVFLYADGADGHKQYAGKVPGGLTFADTRQEVEHKLGPPDRNGGEGVISYYSVWDAEGLQITYQSADVNDMSNRIHHVGLIRKKRAQ